MKDKNGKEIKPYDLVAWSEEDAPKSAEGCAGSALVVDANEISLMLKIEHHMLMIYESEAKKIEIQARPIWLTGSDCEQILSCLDDILKVASDEEESTFYGKLYDKVKNGRI